MFDVIMPVSTKHNDIALLSITSLMQYVMPHNIYVITSKDNFHFFERLQKNYPIITLDENYLISTVNLQSIEEYIENKGQDRQRAGWYLQQFLKMAACFLPDISDYYLIWDADTIMLKYIRFLNDKNQILIKPSSEYHYPYFDTYSKITGKTRSVNFSFISEHFFINKNYMKELITAIEEHTSTEQNWVWKIMNAVDKKYLSGSGFSEYETYGNFVETVHPGTFALRPLKTTRYASKKFGPVPSKYDLYRLSLSCSYASFENWNNDGKLVRILIEKLLSALIYYANPGLYLNKESCVVVNSRTLPAHIYTDTAQRYKVWEADKLVYKEIGETIGRLDSNT